MEHSLDQAFSGHYDNILVTGDFNTNIEASQSNKICRLINSYNATQLINSPTHITEHSQSLIDLMFVKHSRDVLSSFVADPFIPDLTRFHCPIVSVLKLSKPVQSCYRRRIWLYKDGDYNKNRHLLNSNDWTAILNNENLDNAAETLSNVILAAASLSIPNKDVIIRPNDVP